MDSKELANKCRKQFGNNFPSLSDMEVLEWTYQKISRLAVTLFCNGHSLSEFSEQTQAEFALLREIREYSRRIEIERSSPRDVR